MFETIALIVIVTAAAFIQGLTGFGFGLIALPLLGFFIPFKTIIPLMLMLAIFICLTHSIQLRRHIHLKTIAILTFATLPGIPIGAYILQTTPSQPLALILGLLMVTFTVYQLLVNPAPRQLGTPYALFAGFICGVLTASISAGGPPVIIYSALQTWSKDKAKANMAVYFLIAGLAAVSSQAIGGLVTTEVLSLFTMSLPALFVGIFAGTMTYRHITDRGYRNLAVTLIFLLGCMMIYRNI